MESSSGEELEEEFPGHEWITPQSSVNAAYQSQTEKVRFPPFPCRAPRFSTPPLHSGQRMVGNFYLLMCRASSCSFLWGTAPLCLKFAVLDLGLIDGVVRGNLAWGDELILHLL
jgi:hypothetical protein